MKHSISIIFFLAAFVTRSDAQQTLPLLKISDNGRFFCTADGKPFFWLGDTGWLLFAKCNREEAAHYLDTRQRQGFNVVQVMVLHDVNNKNAYGDYALIDADPARPRVTAGNDFNDTAAYDFWDHAEYVIDEAARRNIYVGLVCVWGSNVKSGKVNMSNAAAYAKFLAERFRDKANIIWINGGDIPGDEGMDVWKAIGNTLRKYDDRHLITFHPRGRYSSSDWFQQEPWLDFNMFQSGHKDYSQDTVQKEKHHFGEDNWKFVEADYGQRPSKPTLDGEPSYENIPHGLHDSLQARWSDSDVRRYAYWSILAGGAGFTYGENAVMQFFRSVEGRGSFGANRDWQTTIDAPGANEMRFVKQLMLSLPGYFNRKPAQEVIANDNGQRYNKIIASKGPDYAVIYSFTGKEIKINKISLGFGYRKATWFDPTNGRRQKAKGKNELKSTVTFQPPVRSSGSDWVLILE